MNYFERNLRRQFQEFSPALPSQCFMPEFATERECLDWIATSYEISKSEFNAIAVPAAEGRFYPSSRISELIAGLDCFGAIVDLDPESLTNEHIEFKIIQTADTLINFSISLFHGVLRSNPHAFFFHRAVKNGRRDIAFSAVFDNDIRYYTFSPGRVLTGMEASQPDSLSLQMLLLPCEHSEYQDVLAKKHEFKHEGGKTPKQHFDEAREAYDIVYRRPHLPTLPPPLNIVPAKCSWGQLQGYMGANKCDTFRLRLNVSESDPAVTEIEFSPDHFSLASDYITYYHFPVLHGAQRKHNGNMFHFHLALDKQMMKAVAFEVINANDEVVGWYDLSNEQP